MDFYQIKARSEKKGVVEVYPDFKVCRSTDLMVRGKSFYAVWDSDANMWSTDEYDVQRLVDYDITKYQKELQNTTDEKVKAKLMGNFSSGSWSSFRKYMQNISDNAHQLDEKLTFLNTVVKKKDYVSRRLPYPLEEGSFEAYDEIIGTLYDPDERAKLEWAIGAVVSGDAKDIQKFIVLYGEAGAGKSTILNIIQKLFPGYYTAFEAKALTSSSNAFSTEVFKSNPLVAIQHDGDLSKIEDNTKLNSIVSHEEMTMNEKYKPSYMARVNCFLFMATNRPVKITDAKSGIIRRLIDVRPSGRKVPTKRYQALMAQIDFELGAIASHCLNVYRDMGKNYYSSYRPLEMILQTDVFFNFVEANYHTFKEQDGITLVQAYDMYKAYCEEALVDFKLPRHKFREEMKNYFKSFKDVDRIDGRQVRSYYSGFLSHKFTSVEEVKEEHPDSIVLDQTESIFDELFASCPAQYTNAGGTPIEFWDDVKTKLSDLNTKRLHYVKVPENHIVIDFDLKDEAGNKSFEKNLEAASKWPATYTEFSKSGCGLHLHYNYEGDVTKLANVYDEDIEIKLPVGKSAIRRQLTKCNNIPIATINSGLPLKGDKMINSSAVKSEKSLREMIMRNLRKESHPGTKPSIDFINKILEDAYKSDLKFDVTDMRPKILSFAANSSHQSEYCVKIVSQMHFKSDEPSAACDEYDNDELVFFDVEVFPNLFIIVWKFRGKQKVVMINPKPADIEPLLKLKLIGYNCRRYDNHIVYAAYIGKSNQELFELSQRIINESRNCMFGEAYNLSYTDVYDFASAPNKKSLKKWEIELGIHHQEFGLPWDQPVPEEKWQEAAEYCGNDVDALEVVFDHLHGDWVARQILADLSGLSVNDTTNNHTTKIVFGDDPRPQDKAVYTDLSETFPGYKFESGKSTYHGEAVNEGGYVFATHGVHGNVALLDVASMHPSTIEALNLFGPYTKRYSELKMARVAIKRRDFDAARTMLDGKLAKYLDDDASLAGLSDALKTALNSAYGLTFAKFDNKFRDPRNIDNIVAKRGALFMVDLKYAVKKEGYEVVHIKTDSIKIADATPEIIAFVMDFGKKYGYEFEHEATYDKMCLVNDAVYIAKYASKEKCEELYNYIPKENRKHPEQWTATGAQFAQPYVFKTLFSKEPIVFDDMCETKSVSTALYIDMIKGEEHDYHFVGKVGSFCPMVKGGGLLVREKAGKYYAAEGTTGFKWMEAEMVKTLGLEKDVDRSYYELAVEKAVEAISKYCDKPGGVTDFNWFVGNTPYDGEFDIPF